MEEGQALMGLLILLISILSWIINCTAIVNTSEVKVILCPHPAFENESIFFKERLNVTFASYRQLHKQSATFVYSFQFWF